MQYSKYLIATALLYSCSTTPESERWEPKQVPSASFEGKALVEEFTGQDCIHCPEAARLLKSLSNLHGERIVWVSMHAERSGLVRAELATKEANTYGEYFALKRSLPGIMVNRQPLGNEGLYSQTKDLWAGIMEKALARPSTYDIDLKASLSDNELFVEATAQARQESYNGKDVMLQLWLVEDIEAYQLQAQGSKDNYLHHQVLRTALNGIWGESYQAPAFYRKSFDISQKLRNKERGKVVAFVYDKTNKEVLGVETYALGQSNNTNNEENENNDINRPLIQDTRIWYRAPEKDYRSGDIMICKTVEQREHLDGSKSIELASPYFYLMPGTTYGIGKYTTLKATKLDALDDKASGISQFCAASQCLSNIDMATSIESDPVDITESKLNLAQMVSVHYELSPQAAKKAGEYKVLLELYNGQELISSLTLVFVYKP